MGLFFFLFFFFFGCLEILLVVNKLGTVLGCGVETRHFVQLLGQHSRAAEEHLQKPEKKQGKIRRRKTKTNARKFSSFV